MASAVGRLRSFAGRILVLAALIGPSQAGAIELPGQTAGSFAVSDGGAAIYRIPLQVPPGTGGIAPELALTYSSSGGNGLLGVGWGLEGLSIIHRCGKTLATDGIFGKVTFASSDQFCLDGDRLMHVGGTHGQSGAEYRGEKEIFTRVVAQGSAGTWGPQWFEVRTKGGRILEYGNTELSRLEKAGTSTIQAWHLNRIQDRSGNYLTITYLEDATNGFVRPERIDYTGNANAIPPRAPYASVRFEYEPRSDWFPRYVFGGLRSVVQRLKVIRTYIGTPGTLVREYRLAYDPSPDPRRSRLLSVTECAANGDCLRPTELTWTTAATTTWTSIAGVATLPYDEVFDTLWLSGDVRGTGTTDVIALLRNAGNLQIRVFSPNASGQFAETGTTNPSGWYWLDDDRWVVGDVDGDGFADLVRIRTPYMRVLKSLGDGHFTPLTPQSWYGYASYDGLGLFAADGSGDGLADVYAVSEVSGEKYVSLGDGAFTQTTLGPSTGFAHKIGGDFDGDAATDAGWVYKPSAETVLHIRTSVGPDTNLNYQNSDYRQHFTADVNGDGLSDLVSSWGWYGFLSANRAKGDGTFENTPNFLVSGGWSPDDNWFSADLNGDDCEDLIRVLPLSGSAHFQTWASTCNGSFDGPGSSLGVWQPEDAWLVGDTDGDSFSDVIQVRKVGSNWTFINHRSNGQARDLVTAFRMGIGTEDVVQYKALTDPAVYTKGTGTVYPSGNVVQPAYVVAQHTESNGAAPDRVFSYTYKGGRANLRGRGFLGFEEQTEVDVATGRRTATRFHQDFPLDGLVDFQEVRTSPTPGEGVLEDVDNTWQVVNMGGTPPRYRAELPSSTHHANELDGWLTVTTTTAQVFDTYGNPTTVSTTRQGGGATFTDSTVVTYVAPDLASWLIGVPDLVSTSATAPGVPILSRAVDLSPHSVTGLIMGEARDPTTPFWLNRTYERDAFGNVWRTTESGQDLDVRSTTLTFDAQGRDVEEEENGVGHERTWIHDERFGLPSSQTGPDPAVPAVARQYDDLGRVRLTIHADGTQTEVLRQNCTTGCPVGAVSLGAVYAEQTITSGAPATKVYFDDRGREVSRQTFGFDGTLILVDTEYDTAGRLKRRSQPYYQGGTRFWTEVLYDVKDRIDTVTLPDPAPNVFNADYAGLVTVITDPLLRQRTERRDARGLLVELYEGMIPNRPRNTYAYDAHGNAIAIADSYGNTVTQAWDAAGRRTSINDPDRGYWTFGYNAAGAMISQTDAKSQTTVWTYDDIDRPLTRVEAYDTTTWTWDPTPFGKGQLAQVATSNTPFPVQRSHVYDPKGRLQSTTTTIEGTAYIVGLTYDPHGRVDVTTYPTGLSGFAVQNVYNGNHYLHQVKRSGPPGTIYWQATAMSPYGQVSGETLGNGQLTTSRGFDLRSGRVESIQTGGGAVQSLLYDWDVLGRLESREDLRQPTTREVFGYDAVDRLISVTGTGAPSKTYAYTLAGNLIYKSDLGTLTYPTQVPGAVRPHAVTSAAGVNYNYDNNGNQYQASGRRNVEYSSFNKPVQIVRLPDQLTRSQFAYGADRELVRHWERDSNPATPPATRIHVGDLYERSTAGSYVEHRYSIRAGDALVAIQKDTTSGPELRYVHRDHLGSTDVLSKDTSPATVDRWLSFDPWGRRRNPNWSDPGAPYSFGFEGGVGKELTPEFTGHTALDHFDLVHMGGRVYDPVLGRVLSPDPFLPAPDSTQGLNRYSYVSNNPLSRTDPSGYFATGGNVNVGSDVGFGSGVVLGPVSFLQFESFPQLGGTPSSSSPEWTEGSFNFSVEFSASGLQRGVSEHPFGRIFGSFAEGAFSVLQFPVQTFHPLGHHPLSSPPLNPGASFVGTAVRIAKVGARVVIKGVDKGLTAHDILGEGWRAWEAWNDPEATTADRFIATASAASELAVGVGLSDLKRVGRALEARAAAAGIIPKPGTRVRPPGVPENWRIRPSDSPGGTKYHDPKNPGNQVRVEQGNPNSPYPNSRAPYVRDLRNGQYRDGRGNVVPRDDPAGHIPLQQYPGYRP